MENKLEILGIDVRCGAPILELKNKLQMGDHLIRAICIYNRSKVLA
jgi:hypothetical protein